MFVQNVTELSAAVHDLSCTQTFFFAYRNGQESANQVL